MPGSLITGNAVSVFQAARALEVIPGEVTEQLSGAALTLRNLHGIRQLVMEDDAPVETLSDKARTTMAQSCDREDFDSLVRAVHEATAAAESGLAAVIAQAG